MSSSSNLLQAIAKGAVWNYAIFALSKGGMFLSTLILARILAPQDFGLLALGLLAISYLEALSDCGVGAALIYHQEAPDRTSSVAFHLNLGVSLLLTLVAFQLAPLAAEFFGEPRLTTIIRVLGLSFILSGLRNVHESRLRKQLDFRQRLKPELGKTLVKGTLSILLAACGLGVWSLIWGQLCGSLASTLLYWRASTWRPELYFDFRIARTLLSYGLQIVLIGVLGIISHNIDALIIGHRMDTLQLGYYTMAFQLPQFAIISLCHIVGQSLFPAYAKVQHETTVLQDTFLRSLRYLSLLSVPIGAGLCFVAPQLIQVFYTSHWLSIIPVVQLLSIHALIFSLSFNVGDLYKATGHPGILNKISLIKLPLTIPILWLAGGQSIQAVAAAQVGITIVLTMIRLIIASRILSINLTKILSAFAPAFIGALVMLIGLTTLRMFVLDSGPATSLVLLVISGMLLYVITVGYIERPLFEQLQRSLRNTIHPSSPQERYTKETQMTPSPKDLVSR